MKRPTPRLVLALLVGLLLLVYAGRKIVLALRSDETRVKLVLADVERYANELDTGAVLEYLDPGFKGQHGLGAREVRRIVFVFFSRAKSIDVKIALISPVKVEGDIAVVRVRAHAALKMQGETITLNDAGYTGDTFEVKLKRYNYYFRCLSIRSVGPDEPLE